jgi:hypothetical protein
VRSTSCTTWLVEKAPASRRGSLKRPPPTAVCADGQPSGPPSPRTPPGGGVGNVDPDSAASIRCERAPRAESRTPSTSAAPGARPASTAPSRARPRGFGRSRRGSGRGSPLRRGSSAPGRGSVRSTLANRTRSADVRGSRVRSSTQRSDRSASPPRERPRSPRYSPFRLAGREIGLRGSCGLILA